jgi:hypothetical protein
MSKICSEALLGAAEIQIPFMILSLKYFGHATEE